MPEEIQKINDLWKSYREQVIDADAGEIQLTECKRAFFAGAAALNEILASQVSHLPPSEFDKAVHSLNMELAGFNEAVRLGYA